MHIPNNNLPIAAGPPVKLFVPLECKSDFMVFESNIRVSDIMSEAVTCVRDSTAREAATLMNSRNSRGVVIVDGRNPVGILTETDFVEKIAAENRNSETILVCEIMTSPVITTAPEELLSSAGKKMSSMKIRCMPVIAKGELIGIVSEGDLAKLSPILIENAAERSGICSDANFEREPVSLAGYCENCENYSYDLRQTGAVSGRGPLLCAECRDLFVKDPID